MVLGPAPRRIHLASLAGAGDCCAILLAPAISVPATARDAIPASARCCCGLAGALVSGSGLNADIAFGQAQLRNFLVTPFLTTSYDIGTVFMLLFCLFLVVLVRLCY